jgi:cell pole-organizing protein PopZ
MMSGGAPAPNATPDPSMEDILASIRRILDEEPAPAAEAKPAEDGEELVLDETMLEPDSPAPPTTEPLVTSPPAPEPSPVSQSPQTPPLAPANGGLLNPAAADSASNALHNLARVVAAERGAGVYRGGPTIEDLVREEMRPLLKEWLDTYLPPLVEHLVRAEIERVSRSAA